MNLVLLSLATLLLGAAAAAVAGEGRFKWLGPAGALAGSAIALAASLSPLLTGSVSEISADWNVPLGSLHLGLDPLSAVFVLPISTISGLAAVYGHGYLAGSDPSKRAGGSWSYYNLLVASMLVVVCARNGILFLLAWETMALASFFLVIFDSEKEPTRLAGWVYLVATHLGTAFLLALFVLMGERAGSYEFADWARTGSGLPASLAAPAFVFALVGFGTKAGFVPFHVWLPEAHPAAPSHVSALMSGVMIKTGIYGLLRLLGCLGRPPAWWGWCLLAIGLVSGILGVLFALAQHDLKRLLAYHSVENIGIIMLGIGVGYLGLSYGMPAMAVLGFAGALLHVLNHAIFKGLLFLGAGSVLHATGTGEIDELGGMLKTMRLTGLTFLVGSVAICGLPPLNGFVSEFLIYLGGFTGMARSTAAVAVACAGAITGLAFIGGLAAACFAKAFGVIFLGEPRSDHARHSHEAGALMLGPMAVLAGLCVLIGLLAPIVVAGMGPAVAVLVGARAQVDVSSGLRTATGPLTWIVGISVALALGAAMIGGLRRWLLADRPRGEMGTWDCGYAQPTARMQYTASSFAQPLTGLFWPILRTRRGSKKLKGIFPAGGSFFTETHDLFRRRFYSPLFEHLTGLMAHLRKAQHGRVQLYVLYIVITLIVLLIFSLEFGS